MQPSMGAFTTESGWVEVTWRVNKPTGSLSVAWKETGGPPVRKPEKMSFGTTFIHQSLEYELGGRVDLKFRKSGLECILKLPLSRTVVDREAPQRGE